VGHTCLVYFLQPFQMNDIDLKLCKVRLRPYHVEYTSSRPITEVKQRRARLVLGWVTAWEYRVS
jgi:hypothetical protein